MAHKPPPSPPPLNAELGSLEWQKWFTDTFLKLTGDNRLYWEQLNFDNSDLADLETRSHQDLQDILAGDETSDDATKNRHVADNDLKLAQDHRDNVSNPHSVTSLQAIAAEPNGFVWKHAFTDLAEGKIAGANVPTWSAFRGGIYAYEFHATLDKEVWFTLTIPRDYSPGTDLHPHVLWGDANAVPAGNVRWGLEYALTAVDGTMAVPTTVYATDATPAAQYGLVESHWADIDGTGFTADALLTCRLFRNASDVADTSTQVAHAFHAGFHYQVDRVGSLNHFTPLYT